MRKILVVENNPANMSFFVAVLEHAGHQVLQAEDAETGIRFAREAHPDLIFMDIQLPGMDGLEATRQLKASANTRPIPICALSAFAMKGDEERIRAAGCEGYLAKPVSYKDLLAMTMLGYAKDVNPTFKTPVGTASAPRSYWPGTNY